MTGPVRISLEVVKTLAGAGPIDLDPGRVESVLEIALSNAVNVNNRFKLGRVLNACTCNCTCTCLLALETTPPLW